MPRTMCPEGHELISFQTSSDTWECILCGDDKEIPEGATLHGCRICSYDLCRNCSGVDDVAEQVLVKVQWALDGSPVASLRVSPLFRISGLKTLLEEPSQTPIKYQHLTHGGIDEVLGDDLTIAEVGLPAGSALLLIRKALEDKFALLRACCKDNGESNEALLVRYILNSGEDVIMSGPGPRCAEYQDHTALLHAAKRGKGDICLELLRNERYTALNNRNEHGETDLHLSAKYRMIEPRVPLCRLLLDAERFTEVNAVDQFFGYTALHYALQNTVCHPDHSEREAAYAIVKMLLEHPRFDNDLVLRARGDQDAKYPGSKHCTALHVAAENGNARVCALLLSNASFTAASMVDRQGRTPLHKIPWRLPQELAIDLCRVLLSDERIELNVKDKTGHTALHSFARLAYVEVGRMLLNDPRFTKNDINVKDQHGRTILHFLAMQKPAIQYDAEPLLPRLTEVFSMIMQDERFTELNAVDAEGKTALHMAARHSHSVGENCHPLICRVLLSDSRFTERETKDLDGNTALDIAMPEAKDVIGKVVQCGS